MLPLIEPYYDKLMSILFGNKCVFVGRIQSSIATLTRTHTTMMND